MTRPAMVRRQLDAADRTATRLYARQVALLSRVGVETELSRDLLRRNAELECRLFRAQRHLEAVLTAYVVAGRIPARLVAEILAGSRRRITTNGEERAA